MYAETIKTRHTSRYTSKLKVTDFLNLLENGFWKINYHKDTVAELFELKVKGRHKLERMNPAIRDCFNSDIPRK